MSTQILDNLAGHMSHLDQGYFWNVCYINFSIPLEEVVAYRVDVTGFTASKSSGLEDSLLGTFQGLSEKVQHFKSLGGITFVVVYIFY